MTTFQHATVRGLKLCCREAGSKVSPTIVLLYGFPSASHMFRDLIPQLVDKFHDWEDSTVTSNPARRSPGC